MTDNGAIKGIDVREDGAYITYVPADGADPVSKKLGEQTATKAIEGLMQNASYTMPKDGRIIWSGMWYANAGNTITLNISINGKSVYTVSNSTNGSYYKSGVSDVKAGDIIRVQTSRSGTIATAYSCIWTLT